jgi:DNA-binding Lrp family transcriptional regulator
VEPLTEEQLKILKVMSEVTGRVDMNEFARRIGLAPNEVAEEIQELAKVGFVKKVGGGYGFTEKGRAALKAVKPVPEGMEFHFYVGIGQPTRLSSRTMHEFYLTAKKVDAASLEFHLYRGDFENWVATAVEDTAFANELADLKKTNLMGEELRKEIVKALEARYGFETP